MTKHNSESFIKFTVDLDFYEIDLPIYLGHIGSYRYNCFYRSKTSTSTEGYNVNVERNDKEVNQFSTWDETVELKLYEDSSFGSPINPGTMQAGKPVFLAAHWVVNHQSAFPIVFYFSSCSVKNGDLTDSFELVNSGCTSDLVDLTWYSGRYRSLTHQNISEDLMTKGNIHTH